MRRTLILLGGVAAALVSGAAEESFDLVAYGSSPAAITAAIEAKALGLKAVIVSPETRMGGLTTGGLGQTDIGNKSAFGGLARQFYHDISVHYRDERNWKWQKREDYRSGGQCLGSKDSETMWTFEPSAALAVLSDWERRHGLDIRRGEFLDRGAGGVMKEAGRIRAIRTLSGNVYRGRMFVDATYEGDLMAAAGVTYVVGREGNETYGETINGHAPTARGAGNHNFAPGVDPYVRKGDPSSGLLKGVEPCDPSAKPGDGDRRVQAYCFRMCLTDVPANRIPFSKPEGYDEGDYELLFRNYELGAAKEGFPWINSDMPNRKTDTNNRTGFSTDFIGGNWAWPEASYEERERILREHLRYQQGLMWTLANHPRVPEKIRREVSRWGMCRDEFADGLGGGWQRQLYVREARRLVGDYVMTEHHCRGERTVERPVAMGAYGMDSHHCRRIVTKEGFVRNEGNVEDYIGIDGRRFPPYGIDYGAIVPKRGECENLFVPVCLSASHVAFGSIRMEPVFFALGQVAGAAAAIALRTGGAVQDVDYRQLRQRLLAEGQVLACCGVRERTFVASCDGSEQRYVEIVPDGFRAEAGALIALHGHGSDRRQFVDDGRGECKAAREAAARRGLLYVSPDYRAKTSWMGPKAESDILDLLAKLTRESGVTNFYFCGGSMGGTSVLTFAARHPSLVKGVVALNPLADHLSYTNFQSAIAESFGGGKASARDEYFKRSAVNYSERFVMPVSITTGGADWTVPPESARVLARKISFCRPDLIYYDEVPARRHETDYAASTRAFDEMFRRVDAQAPRFADNTIRLAAVNSSAPDRAAATFVCTGENDEAVFNRAVGLLPFGGRIVLADGDYYFDACTNEGGSAVFLGYNGGRARVVTFAGVTDSKAYNTRYGAGIHVTEKAMNAMATNGVYRVFYGSPERPPRGDFGPYPGDFYTYTHVNNLRLENLQILFWNASRPLRGVDGSNFGSLYLKKVGIYQENYFRDRFMHLGRPDIPCVGTVGVWSVPGSNDEAAEIRYDHVQVGGLHTGFVFDGVDHLIMEVSAACRCVQGYDFRRGAKTLTVINCADEGNTYLPRFRGKFGHITMLDFNIERFNERFIPVDPEPGRTEHLATEDFPGTWHGDITYTLQGGCFGFGLGANPFWAPGHGAGVRTVDQNAPLK